MNVNITVTLTASPELLEVLRALAPAPIDTEHTINMTWIEPKQEAPQGDPGTGEAPAKKTRAPKPEPKKEDPKPEPKAEAPKEPEAEDEELTLAMVQELARKRAMGGRKDGVKALLDKAGVAKITDLAIDQLPEFYAKLQAL
jgi:hypothetical protein